MRRGPGVRRPLRTLRPVFRMMLEVCPRQTTLVDPVEGSGRSSPPSLPLDMGQASRSPGRPRRSSPRAGHQAEKAGGSAERPSLARNLAAAGGDRQGRGAGRGAAAAESGNSFPLLALPAPFPGVPTGYRERENEMLSGFPSPGPASGLRPARERRAAGAPESGASPPVRRPNPGGSRLPNAPLLDRTALEGVPGFGPVPRKLVSHEPRGSGHPGSGRGRARRAGPPVHLCAAARLTDARNSQ